MVKRRSGAVAAIVFAAVLTVGALGIALNKEKTMWFFSKKNTVRFSPTAEAVKNPLMGFAAAATSRSNVGDNSLVYIDVTFRELEPSEGDFDFAGIAKENYIEFWRSEGKHAVLRFVCDIPGEQAHLDIPDWLFEKMNKDGDFYNVSYGKGFSPNYANKVFIEHHAKAVKALGEYFGRDYFVAYVELGSLGHWGEWHVKVSGGIRRLPLAEVRYDYILAYREAFPLAKLMMRRPFAPAAEYGFGLYNDMVGQEEGTKTWMEWIQHGGDYDQTGEAGALVPMPDAWMTSPIGGELSPAISMDWMVKDNIDATLGMISDAHTTFLGPKFPKPGNAADDEALQTGIEKILVSMGYRIGVVQSEISRSRFSPHTKVTLAWENKGVAPMYFPWPVYLVVLDMQSNPLERYLIDLDTTKLLPKKVIETVTVCDLTRFENQPFRLCVGIYNPATDVPAVLLTFGAERFGALSAVDENL